MPEIPRIALTQLRKSFPDSGAELGLGICRN